MPLKHFFKTIFQPQPTPPRLPPLNDEIVYSKNNVCVHPQGLLASTVKHHTGYLTIFAKVSNDATSLILNWIPNEKLTLVKHPIQDEDLILKLHKTVSCTRGDKENMLQESSSVCKNQSSAEGGVESDGLSDASISSDSTEGPDSATETDVSSVEEFRYEDEAADILNKHSRINLCLSSRRKMPECAVSVQESNKNECFRHSTNASTTMESAISPPVIHNMQFPENSVSFFPSSASSSESSATQNRGQVKRPVKDQACGVFTVDLSLMRSLRLFFSNDACNSGQLVIASRESQYKILHFHHGGLDALADILEQWKLAVKVNEKVSDQFAVRYFSICGPQLSLGQCHPEEGLYQRLTVDAWSLHVNEFGQIEDEYNIRKSVFFGGMDPRLRPEVWLFLLKCYPFSSTYDERQEIKLRKHKEYQDINTRRINMTHDQKQLFKRNVACIVEKDVLRTDRANPFYRGDNNPNLTVLRHILLNYAVHADALYTQGMSELLSPLLIELKDESETFWCFVGLMQRTIFISSPKDDDMEKQLMYLRELLRLIQPQFYEHLKNCGPDAMELLFVHRWILLCFKREFIEEEALMMWESCWAHYQTDYFHLFICVAIISIYGTDVVENKLASDEMLLHFSNLAMQMNGNVVLRKARGLLHSFRVLPRVPCTLHDICIMSPPGVWDSGYAPAVECTGMHESGDCTYGGRVSKGLLTFSEAVKNGDLKLWDIFK